MKTSEQIKQMIDKNSIAIICAKPSEKKLKAKLTEEIVFFREMLAYLSTNPRQEFIESEVKRLQTRKDKILEECSKFKSKISVNNYKSVQGYSQINKQLKTLNFLLC